MVSGSLLRYYSRSRCQSRLIVYPDREFHAIFKLCTPEYAFHMHLDGLLRDTKKLRDHFVGLTLSDGRDNLTFPALQYILFFRAIAAGSVEYAAKSGSEPLAKYDFPLQRMPHAFEQFLGFHVLKQISGGTVAQSFG